MEISERMDPLKPLSPTTSTNENAKLESLSSLSDTQSAASSAKPNHGRLSSIFKFTKARFVGIGIALLILVVCVGGYFAVAKLAAKTKPQSSYPGITEQQLGLSDLKKLNSPVTIDSSAKTLTFNPNSIFQGDITVAKDLNLTGRLNTTGPLAVSSLNVSGSSTLAALQVGNNLNVIGLSTLQGGLSVKGSLSVNGSGSFNGDLSANTISTRTLNSGSLVITGHLVTGGGTPKISPGGIGAGGKVSIVGNDTTGTITIDTGSNPTAGTLATISFSAAYTNSPHVTISPIGSTSSGLQYYLNRFFTDFTINTSSSPAPNTEYAFDYIVAQ